MSYVLLLIGLIVPVIGFGVIGLYLYSRFMETQDKLDKYSSLSQHETNPEKTTFKNKTARHPQP